MRLIVVAGSIDSKERGLIFCAILVIAIVNFRQHRLPELRGRRLPLSVGELLPVEHGFPAPQSGAMEAEPSVLLIPDQLSAALRTHHLPCRAVASCSMRTTGEPY